MQAIRKPFFGDPLFPFELVYQATRTRLSELPDHLHDRYELVYIHQGSGTFFIDKTFYEKKPGDLYIIPGNTIHRAFPNEHNPVISSAVFFAPHFIYSPSLHDDYSHLAIFEFAKKKKSYQITLTDHLKSTTESILEIMKDEIAQRDTGYREAIRLHLCQLLLQLNRRYLIDVRNHALDVQIGPPWMKEVLRLIDEHPEQPWGLATCAERASIHPAHFSRVFKQMTGMNITDYINAKRIVRVKEQLRDSNKNIAEIAERCGFTSLPHFYQLFKSLTGMTPRQYQRKGLIYIAP
jgi:AraC-like DNA-binding protein